MVAKKAKVDIEPADYFILYTVSGRDIFTRLVKNWPTNWAKDAVKTKQARRTVERTTVRL